MKHILCSLLIVFATMVASGDVCAQNSGVGVRVIVIDAGHGGAFPGAIYGKVKEKDLNLKVALKLGALIEKELPDVKVVYTRKSDIALGKSLNEDLTARANIANKAEGDFFISIHANAAPKATSVYGVETIIMGESEKETRYNESALYDNNKDELIDMSDENTAAMVRAYIQNLQFTYGEYSEMMARIMQSHYAKGGRNARKVKRQLLKVLYATDMPSVLTELGFMTNKSELAYMRSEKGQNELARMLCNAVKEYFAHLDGTASALVSDNVAEEVPAAMEKENLVAENVSVAEPAKQEVVADKAEAVEASAEGYAIQLLASDKKLKTSDAQFKTYRGKVKCYEGSGVLKYKYCYGEFATRAEAQQNVAVVRKVFKDAFVIHFSDGKIVK